MNDVAPASSSNDPAPSTAPAGDSGRGGPGSSAPGAAPVSVEGATALRRGAHSAGAKLADLIRRGNRRRLTLRGKDGTVWLRLPLTVAVVLALVATFNWLALVLLLVVIGYVFATGAQLTVERLA